MNVHRQLDQKLGLSRCLLNWAVRLLRMTCDTEQDSLVFLEDRCYVYAWTETSLEKRSVLWVVLTRYVDTWCVGRGAATCGHALWVYRRKRDLGKDAALAEGQVHMSPQVRPLLCPASQAWRAGVWGRIPRGHLRGLSPGSEGPCSLSLGMEGPSASGASGRAGRALLQHARPHPNLNLPTQQAAHPDGTLAGARAPCPLRPVLRACAQIWSGADRGGADLGTTGYWVSQLWVARATPGRRGCGGSQRCPRQAVGGARWTAPAPVHWPLC